MVREILYDCHGRFEGFVLEAGGSSRAFKGCESSLESVLVRTCCDRSRLTVFGDHDHVGRVVVHCC